MSDLEKARLALQDFLATNDPQALEDLYAYLNHANLRREDSDMNNLQVWTLIERLRADLVFHQSESERITREWVDADASDPLLGARDAEENFHAGRVEALTDVINILSGREVKLYSEEYTDSQRYVQTHPYIPSIHEGEEN